MQVANLRVATWNVEHFAYPIDAGCRPREQSELEAMKAYVSKVDADIFALQEVDSKQAAHLLFPENEWQVFMSPRKSNDPFTCRRNGNDSTQLKLAYAVKKGINVTAVKGISEFALARSGLRYGLELNVDTALGNITLLNVHMKSGCFVDNYSRSDSDSCKTFAQQAPILDAWIEAQEENKTQYVVLGDFNHRLTAPYNHLTQALFTNSNGSQSSLRNATSQLIGCHPYYPAPIDLIFVGGMSNNNLSINTQAHDFINMNPDDMLSDHCAVTLDMNVASFPLSTAVKWQTQSKEYKFLTQAMYKEATNTLNNAELPLDNWVVVMDVDETILDNSQYQVMLDKVGGSYSPKSWANWVRKEQATLVPGVNKFIDAVIANGGKLAFITNRDKTLDAFTWRNLTQLGLPINMNNTCLIGRSQPDKDAVAYDGYMNDKDLRREQVELGEAGCYEMSKDGAQSNNWKQKHQIVMEVGDNIEDFSFVTQEGAIPDELIQQWPARFILLPNPMYGSW